MSQVFFSQAAISDIEQIWDYTHDRWGVDQAERYTKELRAGCQDLALGRKFGRPVVGKVGYLRMAIGRHVVFFKEQGSGIKVIRILHQRMDVESRLGD